MAKNPIAQIRWYVKHESEHDDSTYDPDNHTINLLIINRQDEIYGILQKFYEKARPILEDTTRTHGSVNGSNMAYELHTITTKGMNPDNLPWKSVFDGQVRKDRELRERTSQDTLEIYVDSHISKLAS